MNRSQEQHAAWMRKRADGRSPFAQQFDDETTDAVHGTPQHVYRQADIEAGRQYAAKERNRLAAIRAHYGK